MHRKCNTDKTHDRKLGFYLELGRAILIHKVTFQGTIKNNKREFCRLIGGSKLPQEYVPLRLYLK